MKRSIGWLVGGAALAGAMVVTAAAATPAAAHRFHGFHRFGFGFGFGYPVFYPPPPIYPVYYPPRVAFIPPPPPPPVAYGYGYRRVVVRHRYHHVVHHRWCSCSCCR
jgi:hypothetical protein